MQHQPSPRKVNPRVRSLVDRYVNGCVPKTRINAKALARQLSDRDRVFLAGTIAQLLQKRDDLQCDAVNEYVVA